MKFVVEIPDSDVAALRAGIRAGGVIPGVGREFGRHVRDRVYAQVIEQLGGGEIAHRHTEAQLLRGTPEALRPAFGELRDALDEPEDFDRWKAER